MVVIYFALLVFSVVQFIARFTVGVTLWVAYLFVGFEGKVLNTPTGAFLGSRSLRVSRGSGHPIHRAV